MRRTVVSAWKHGEDGKLEHSDYKVCIHDEDSIYELETSRPDMGIELGSNRDGNTIITHILDSDKTLEKIKAFINVGDILIAVNDRVVLDEPFSDVMSIVDLLTLGGFPRRYKFLNQRKCSLEAYLKKIELSNKFKTDMLGFTSSVEEILSEQNLRQQTKAITIQRDMEWVDYLKSIGGPENLKPAGVYKPSPDLKAMVRRGIPVAFRALVWPRISLSSIHRLQYPHNYYQQLLDRVEAGELSAKVKDDIEKDVDRTFPEHVYFGHSGRGESFLRRVLHAFAIHNPEIGYCQSLNFVAGMILILLEEEEAFWLLVTIVEKLLPPDYYTKSMVGTYVDQFVLAHIIKKYLPRIHASMEKNQLQLPLITVQWFMCIFVNTLRPEVTLRVWDMFLNEGNKVLFRIAAGLFKLHEKKLMTVKDAGDLFTVLRVIGKDVVDADVLIAAAYKDFSKMQRLVRSRSVSNSSSASKIPSAVTSKSNTPNRNNQQKKDSELATPPQSPGVMQRRRTIASKIHTSFSTFISPRLSSKSVLGAVPQDLIGVGFAHTGPVDALERYRTESTGNRASNDEQQAVVDVLAENSMRAHGDRISKVLTAEEATLDASNTDPNIKEDEVGGTTVEDDDDETTNTHGEGFEVSSFPSDVRKYDDELVANPGVLLNRVSEINRAGSISEFKKQFDATKGRPKVKKSEQRDRKTKNGELSFYRADIALWRSSFRPGLEERHSMMEAARSKWRSENAVALAAASASSGVANGVVGGDNSPTSSVNDNIDAPSTSGAAVVMHGGVSIDKLSVSRPKSTALNGQHASSFSSSSNDSSKNACTSTTTSEGTHENCASGGVVSANFVRRTSHSNRSRSNSGIFSSPFSSSTPEVATNSMDDEEAIVLETTYSIDHTFDTDPVEPVTIPQILGLRPRLSFTQHNQSSLNSSILQLESEHDKINNNNSDDDNEVGH